MNKKNRKKVHIRVYLISCFMAVMLLVSMSGCRLAVGDGDGAQSRDNLIGATITKEEIEKIYAEVTWDEETIEELRFDGMEGNYLIYTTRENDDGTLVYGTVGTEGMDSQSKYSTIDEKGSIELIINAYTIPDEEEHCSIYMNPIYMTEKKEVYTVGGAKLSVGKEDAIGGASTGKSITETEKLKWIDKEIEVSVKVTANLYVADQPVNITFSEMNENHEVIKKTEYEPGKVPEFITAGNETAYILVESELTGLLGGNKTNLEMCSWDGITTYRDEDDKNAPEQNATLTHTFYSAPNGLLLKNNTWVIWPEE